jgi:hypothetical protein
MTHALVRLQKVGYAVRQYFQLMVLAENLIEIYIVTRQIWNSAMEAFCGMLEM